MIRYTSTRTINRQVPTVFAALLDAGFYSEWTEMQDTAWDGQGHVRVGTTGSFRFPSGPFAGTLRMEVVALEPDRRFVVRVAHPRLAWLATTDLEADGAATRMTYAGEIKLKGLVRLLEPFIRGEVARGEAMEAERFKALLEGTAATPEGATDTA